MEAHSCASKILAVRAADYAQWLAPARFNALPGEEIERLHGCLEVLTVDGALTDEAPRYLPLRALTVLHYNYTWLTFGGSPPRLGLVTGFAVTRPTPPFLDPTFQRLTQHAVEARLTLPECEWRLVGLLHDAELLFVYVARLRQAWRAPAMRDGTALLQYSSGGLSFARADFDPQSQTLIDHLHAF